MKKDVRRFIVLVPHRDSLKPLEEYRAKLFAAGFIGAWSFPMTAPLASVSRPFNADELKEPGRNIRDLTKKTDGKIICSGSVNSIYTTENTELYSEGTEEERRRPLTGARGHGDKKGLSFFGVPLNLAVEEAIFPQTARDKILGIFSPPVLCAALVDSGEKPPSEEGPSLSFRAASLANLAIRPLESGAAGYSFEWKMGPLIWLPKYKADN